MKFLPWCLLFFFFLPLTKQTCQSTNFEQLGSFYFSKAVEFYSENFDSTIFYLDLAIPHFEESKNWLKLVDCYNGLFAVYYYQGKFIEAEKSIKKGYNLALEKLASTDLPFVHSISNLGSLYSEKRMHEKALNLYRKVEVMSRDLNDLPSLATAFHNIGNTYELIGDYENAIFYFDQALKIRIDTFGVYDKSVAVNYFSLGFLKLKNKSYYKSIKDLKFSLNIFEKLERNEYNLNQRINIYHNLAKAYLKLNNQDSVFYYLGEAKKIQNYTSYRVYLTEEIFQDYYNLKGDVFSALKASEKAVLLAKKNFNYSKNHPVIGRCYNNLAKQYIQLKDYKNAIKNSQNALNNVTALPVDSNMFYNPPINELITTDFNFDIFKNKTIALFNLYINSHREQNFLFASKNTSHLATQLIQKARQDIITSGSKQQLATEALPIYESAIQVALELHKVTGEEKYLEQAFQFAESNKAILLLESINEEVAKNYGGIPDSLLEKERDLRVEIAFYERIINENKQKGETEKIINWESELFDFRQAYNNLVDLLENEYPNYYQLKYDTRLVSVKEVQEKLLDKESILLEYFVGEENIYIFQISQHAFKVTELHKSDQFETELSAFLNMLNRPRGSISDFEEYIHLANRIFKQYLAPAIDKLPEDIKRLIIIPDDQLNYLPFEALLVQAAERTNFTYSPSKLHYLLEEYVLNYNYSATLLANSIREQPAQQRKLKPLLAMAPSFSSPLANGNRNCSADELYSLSCSPYEVKIIGKLGNGKVFLGTEATKECFEKEAPNYRILHLATHSCSDQEDPRFSKIYFKDDYLSNLDLFNLNLKAELAVLSSCNTGSGQLVRGDGVMSLSKGFIHAGIPSTLISLWSVDDCATSDIMIRFYKELKKGRPKDEALQQAKIKYLEQADKAHQHPYYWAAFVQMGRFSPIDLKDSFPGWALFLLSLTFLTGLGLVYRRRFNKAV